VLLVDDAPDDLVGIGAARFGTVAFLSKQRPVLRSRFSDSLLPFDPGLRRAATGLG
jgi:hypothetical protein